MATGMITEDAESPPTEDTDNSSDEEVASDDEVPKEDNVCPSLIHDHRLQRSLLQLEDEEAVDETAVEARNLSLNLIKFMGDMCGWVPDPNVQHRRQPVEKQLPKAGKTKRDGTGGLSASRRLSHQRSTQGQNQQTANPDFEFKHYSNIRRYSEQYRRYHTCGGPLQKLTQSAFGRSWTIYYAGDATADAGVDVGSTVTRSGALHHQQQPSMNRSGPGHGGNVARGSTEVPNSNKQPVVTYSDISVNSPRYNLLSDTAQRKRHPTMNWTHLQKNGAGHPGGQPWNVGMNDQTLTVYTSRAPSPHHAPSSSPPKSHLPYFPSQQPLKQLPTASRMSPSGGSNPTNNLLHNGFSLDKTLGTPVTSSSTGISLNPGPHRDFYSQLMHAAHCLRLAKDYSSSDFEFELPRWPTLTMHHDVTSTASQHTAPAKKSPQSTPPPHKPNIQVQIKGRGGNTPPTHHTTKSASQLHTTKRHTTSSKTTPVYTFADPTSATKETHFITIEAPTCSPFDMRSAPAHAKRTSPEVSKTSYRVTLKKEKPVEDSSPVDIVANSNRPIAVCELTWF